MVCWEIAWGVGGKVGRWVCVMSVVFFPGKTGRQVNPGLKQSRMTAAHSSWGSPFLSGMVFGKMALCSAGSVVIAAILLPRVQSAGWFW